MVQSCGAEQRLWVPYRTDLKAALEARSAADRAANGTACASSCVAAVTTTQPSLAAVNACNECLKTQTAAAQAGYGCLWCQYSYAPLTYFLQSVKGVNRQPTGAEVQAWYRNDNQPVFTQEGGTRAEIQAAWDQLTQCEQGKWARQACVEDETFPVTVTDSPFSGGGSSSFPGWVIGLIVGGLLALVVLALVLWNGDLKAWWKKTFGATSTDPYTWPGRTTKSTPRRPSSLPPRRPPPLPPRRKEKPPAPKNYPKPKKQPTRKTPDLPPPLQLRLNPQPSPTDEQKPSSPPDETQPSWPPTPPRTGRRPSVRNDDLTAAPPRQRSPASSTGKSRVRRRRKPGTSKRSKSQSREKR